MKLIFSFIFFFTFSNANSQTVFEERQIEHIQGRVSKILLLGTGSSTTRIFLDNLSNQLIKKFNDKNIFAKYQYLDKDDIKERNVLDTLIKEGYDVVLFLLPNGHSYFGVENNDYRSAAETPIGTIRTNIRSSSVSYMQQFNFKLSYPDKSMKTFWSAFVEVSGDPGKKKTSKSLVDKLFICFKNNKYIE